MKMSDFAQILEEELEEAVEIKNQKSLHRYITLLTSTMVHKDDAGKEHGGFQQALLKLDGKFNLLLTEVRDGFKHMDQRFEQVDKRFEQVDKRFEQVDKRFEQVDKRFVQVDKRLEQMDKRFEALDRRYESLGSRLDILNHQMFRFMIWSFSTTITTAGIIIAILKLT